MRHLNNYANCGDNPRDNYIKNVKTKTPISKSIIIISQIQFLTVFWEEHSEPCASAALLFKALFGQSSVGQCTQVLPSVQVSSKTKDKKAAELFVRSRNLF